MQYLLNLDLTTNFIKKKRKKEGINNVFIVFLWQIEYLNARQVVPKQKNEIFSTMLCRNSNSTSPFIGKNLMSKNSKD